MKPILSVSLAFLVAACGLDAGGSISRGDSYEAAVQNADAARKAGDYDTAIPLYGRALQADPTGVQAKLGLGQSLLAVGAPDEAAAQFRDVLAKRARDPVARRGLASALLATGQPLLAEQQLEAALQSDPNDYRALNGLGVALDMQGRHVEAQGRYRRGIELAPDFLPLRSNFGLSLAITGQVQEAMAQLVPIARSRAADARVRQNLAFAYAMAGDFENALQLIRSDVAETSAQQQLYYFMQLRSLSPEARSAEMLRNPSFFPQPSSGV